MHFLTRSTVWILLAGITLSLFATTFNVLVASALSDGFLSGQNLLQGWANSTVQEVVQGGANSVFLGAPRILFPWEFAVLLVLSLIAAGASFYFAGKVLQPLAIDSIPKMRERAAVQAIACLLFFLLPFLVARLSFSIAVTLVVLELVFWPLEWFVQQQQKLARQQKRFTV